MTFCMILLLVFTLDSEGKAGKNMDHLYSPSNLIYVILEVISPTEFFLLVGPDNILIFHLVDHYINKNCITAQHL